MKTMTFNRKHDEGKDVSEALDLSRARHRPLEQKRSNVDSPTWMTQALHREPKPVRETRQSIIKVWQAARRERLATDHLSSSDTDSTPAG